ncbi:hypothetical protein NQ315_006913 [Exocentrus adspersus]|uniref:Uncharacterized protein n=1 Tax=Exocentrus adspersus TaxID=1586481 RepID=A0AAV8WBV2_9CUCU|nr:hypothetical protein NQ315_006913 [Exocentrus adspersus]
MKLSLLAILAICAFAYGAVIKVGDDGLYEIVAGNCSEALARDMIFHDHVHKTRLPLISRDATSSWKGNQTIYCLKVLNDKDESKGATCLIKEGGVGYNNVTIDMHSPANHGLEFDIQVQIVLFAYEVIGDEHQIIDGYCDDALEKDLVFHDHVYRSRVPPIIRYATSSWQGNQTIYCLKVLNDNEASQSASCQVANGGVGYNNVTITMHSLRAQSLEFDIQVYVK